MDCFPAPGRKCWKREKRGLLVESPWDWSCSFWGGAVRLVGWGGSEWEEDSEGEDSGWRCCLVSVGLSTSLLVMIGLGVCSEVSSSSFMRAALMSKVGTCWPDCGARGERGGIGAGD